MLEFLEKPTDEIVTLELNKEYVQNEISNNCDLKITVDMFKLVQERAEQMEEYEVCSLLRDILKHI